MTAPTTSPYTRAQLLEHARGALKLRILYWLGAGASESGEPTDPSTPIDPKAALDEKRRHPEYADVVRQYDEAMRQLGLRFDDLPRRACDCSGFVAWALGVARQQPLAGSEWMNTDSIHADATRGHSQFEVVTVAQPGDFLVYPSPGKPKPGHIGIVSEVDAAGRPLKVIHCAPDNFRIVQPDGRRTAIAATDLAIFEASPATRIVAYKRFNA
ncbi:MAG: CHAP domain-containing protein [Rubrivivax sp.]|nr:CHAP domain-containing protein [Rubrivivax sp.]